MSNNYSQDIPYTKQSDVQEYIDAFDIDNESIDFATLENYSNSDYVFNTNALQKVKNNIDVMQSDFNNDIISDLDDKQELFQSWVNNLSANAKPWQPGVENKYYKNDVVTHSEDPGAYFICLEDCDGTKPINYVKFTNTYNNIDYFNWGLCVNGDVDDENTSFIGESDGGTFPLFKLTYRYDGNYTLRFTKRDDFVGEIDYFIFKGSKELFEHMNYVVDDSKWLRIYLRGKAGLDAFKFDWRGEWDAKSAYNNEKSYAPGSIIPGSLVWYKILNNINFYFCIRDVSNSTISPDQDTTHWVKLFTKKLDGFIILDSMPNQAWFDDDTNPSVFGVQQNVYYYSASTEKYDSKTMRAKNNSVSFVTQSPDEIKKVVVRCEFYRNNELYYSKNYTINNLRALYPPSVIGGIGFQIHDDKNNDVSVGFMCNYNYDQHRITLKVDNVQTAYSEIYTYSFCAYIESIYAGDPLLKIVDRVHSESASNPQYLKLYTVANNVVDNNDNNLNTLINNLIGKTNI